MRRDEVERHSQSWSNKRERQRRSTTMRYASNRDCTGTSSLRKTPTSGRPPATSNQTKGWGGPKSLHYRRRVDPRQLIIPSKPNSCLLPSSHHYPIL